MKQVVKGLATRGNGNWLASTQGLPDGKQALAAGKTWKQVQAMLQEAAELVLRVPPGSVTIDMEFEDPELQKLVDEAHRTKAVLRDAQFEMNAAMGVAEILGCSHQHVAKLAPKGREDGPGDTPKD